MAVPLQSPYAQFFDDNGDPLSGGKVYTYVSGTTTNKATYTDASEVTPAANPVVLDSAGRAAIWIVGTYRFDVKTSADVLVRSVDAVPAFTAGGDMTKAVYDPANIAQQLVGTTAVQTVTNKIMNLASSTTAAASLNVPAGTAPTAPVNGDIWTTTSGAYARINGVTKQLDSSAGFTSTAQPITSGGLLTLAHGLSYTPDEFFCWLVNVTTQGGWVTNDVVPVGLGANYAANTGTGIYADGTNVYVRFGSDTQSFGLNNKTTGATFGITNASWTFKIRAR